MSSSPTEASSAGTIQVTMPQMGVSVAEGTILEWRKRPGDWVESDETICDISTDKIDVEIPSPASGRVERILVEPGMTVEIGTPLAEIDPEARPGESHPDEHHDDRSSSSHRPAAPAADEGRPPVEAGGADGEADRSRFYSPIVRRIAEEHGVDLERVQGSGIGGRIRKRDLIAYIDSRPQGDAEQIQATEEAPLHISSPYTEAAEAKPTPAGPAMVEDLAPGRREAMSPMRRQIARHMVESRRTAAHCTTVVEVDFSAVVGRRRALKDGMERRGVPLTYLAFLATAAVETLADHPKLNASVEEEEIVYHDDVNLGIAVALDDGLIVPVIRRAQRLSLEGMAAAIAEVASRARERQLQPDDVHGGTFTITNPGQFGAVLATPIINQPQVAILDLEAVVKRPVVVEGPDGDAIAIRPMSYLCMSWDHRALDGADAARFLSDVKQRLEREEAGG
jgi:2-oxoglutarate dehydrogenase dihydrolipoamide succinyltransferase (E2 component)